jgi:ATP-dependent protease ClpP protease subunit
MYMVHRGSATYSGSMQEIESASAADKLVDVAHDAALASMCRVTPAQLQEVMATGDVYFGAEFAKAHGFTDRLGFPKAQENK